MTSSLFPPSRDTYHKQNPPTSTTFSPPRSIRYCLNVQPIQGIQRVTLEVLIDAGTETDSSVETRPLVQIINPRRIFPHYITPQDAEWIHQLQTRSKIAHASHIFILFSAEEENLMMQIIASGRCHFSLPTQRPLRIGPAIPATLQWQVINDKQLRLNLEIRARLQRILPLSRPYYYQIRPGRVGLLQVAGHANPIALLLGMGEINLTDLPDWDWPSLGLPTPPEVHCTRIEKTRPIPVLMLTTANPDSRPIARLFFDYRGHALEVALPARSQSLARIRPTHFVRIERDTELEQQALNLLLDMGLQLFKSTIGRRHQRVLGCPKEQQEFVWQRVMGQLEELRQQQWKIKIAQSFNFLESHQVQWAIQASARPDQSINADLFLQIQGQRIPLLPLIGNWLRGQNSKSPTPPQLQLPDGKTAFLDPARVEAILNAFAGIFDRPSRSASRDAPFSLPAQSLPMLAQLKQNLTGADIQWQTDPLITESLEQLDALRAPTPIEAPAELNAKLRDYQRVGLGWLSQLSRMGYHGILADDMGLGKTIQVIAHILNEKQAGRLDLPALIIAPTSLLYNWQSEIKRFAPTLRSAIHHGSERHEHLDHLHDYEIIITSYTLLVRDADMHCRHQYSYLVLDESQKIKNPTTVVAQTASMIHARHRLCLTGTPIENHLGELWSQFNFLMPGLLGSRRQFERFYQIPIERLGNVERRNRLTEWLATFILRRTKQSVALELPPKTEIVRYVQLGDAQRELYETIRLAILPQLRDYVQKKAPRYAVNVLTALLKLRQVCCDPRLVDGSGSFTAEHSAKMDMLLEMVTAMVEEGRRILIFSQFTSMLKLISQALTDASIPWLKLTGRTRHRQPLIDQFQEGETPVFLISLKAGGTGLNLTAADVVIHYDPWWNPAVEQQATDRAHRIGQTLPVFSYKLIAAGTVEERIAQLQIRKQALADDILSAAVVTRALDQAEWESLFAPMASSEPADE